MRHVHISGKSDGEKQFSPTRSTLFISQPGVRSKWFRPRIRGTQVKSSMRMKKAQESSKWLFLGI